MNTKRENEPILGNETPNTQTDLITRNLNLVKSLASEHYAQLTSSRESVFDLLNHETSDVRAAAIICGEVKWACGNDPLFQQMCCHIAATDEYLPRSIAINAIRSIFNDSKNRGIQRLLALIVRDSSLSNEIRNLAYRTLREVELGFVLELFYESMNEGEIKLKGGIIPLTEIDWDLLRNIENS